MLLETQFLPLSLMKDIKNHQTFQVDLIYLYLSNTECLQKEGGGVWLSLQSTLKILPCPILLKSQAPHTGDNGLMGREITIYSGTLPTYLVHMIELGMIII